MHFVGSPTDEYNHQLSLMYASKCRPGKTFVFCFALVFPDGQWGFPSSLERAAVDSVEKVPLPVAMGKITAWKPDVIYAHLLCFTGQTIYR